MGGVFAIGPPQPVGEGGWWAENAVTQRTRRQRELRPMGKQSNLTIEQRTAAALSLIRKEEPAAKIARRYGVSEPTLYRYRDLFLEGGKAGVASGAGKSDSRDKRIEKLERALEERDQVIGELTIANRIFKKLSGECP